MSQPPKKKAMGHFPLHDMESHVLTKNGVSLGETLGELLAASLGETVRELAAYIEVSVGETVASLGVNVTVLSALLGVNQ